MIDRPVGFLQMGGAILSDRQEAIRQAVAALSAHPFEPFRQGPCHGGRHALAGELCQLPREPMRLVALDVQAHQIPFHLIWIYFYQNRLPRAILRSRRAPNITSTQPPLDEPASWSMPNFSPAISIS